MTPSTPGAASKDDHKKQRRRERAGRESRLVSYGLSALAAVLAAVVYLRMPAPAAGVCGDGLCGYDETEAGCPADCKGFCGDGFCSLGETCSGVPQDDPTYKPHRGVEVCEADCGECDASATLAAAACGAADTGLTEAHNNSLLWGSYRPHLFAGMRTRSSAPVLVGVMWHAVDRIDPLRYEATSHEIKSFGWTRHDGRSFGTQVSELVCVFACACAYVSVCMHVRTYTQINSVHAYSRSRVHRFFHT